MRFISEDTYRGNLEDPLSLNYYTYAHNNPLIYVDPDGHSILDVFDYIGARAIAFLDAGVDFIVDAVGGIARFARSVTDTGLAEVGMLGNFIGNKIGIIGQEKYETNREYFLSTITKNGQRYMDMPGQIWNGITENFSTTFNKENLMNYLDPNASYDEIKSYSKSVIQTGVTVYGATKITTTVGKSIGKNIKVTPGGISQVDTGLGWTETSVVLPSITKTGALVDAGVISDVTTGAMFIAGGSGNSGKKPSLNNLSEKEAERIVKENGFKDNHEFKESIVGEGDRSKFNIKINKSTGEIYLEGIKNKVQIPTGIYK